MGQELVNAFIAVSTSLGLAALLAKWFQARIKRQEADHSRQLTKEEQREAEITNLNAKILQISIDLAACEAERKYWQQRSDRGDQQRADRNDQQQSDQKRPDNTRSQ